MQRFGNNMSIRGPAGRHPRRRGFSLAELMIAIGILGVGMLMVATTFPLGIEQTRRATNDTLGPIVAREAFTSLETLLRERNPRVAIDLNDSSTIAKGAEVFRLRDLLTSGSPPVVWTNSVNVGPPVSPANVAFDINTWLWDQEEYPAGGYVQAYGAPSPAPKELPEEGGPGYWNPPRAPLVAAYPSRLPLWTGSTPPPWPPSLNDYRYFWSMLYHFPTRFDTAMGWVPDTTRIEVALFVNRRPEKPVPFYVQKDDKLGLPAVVVLDNDDKHPMYPNMKASQIITKLDPNLTLVTQLPDATGSGAGLYSYGQMRIREIVPVAYTVPGRPPALLLEYDNPLSMAMLALPTDTPFPVWAIWRDPNTGASPNIAVYQKTIYLD